jgi:hypothetical protein
MLLTKTETKIRFLGNENSFPRIVGNENSFPTYSIVICFSLRSKPHIFSFLGGRTQELVFRNSFPSLSPRLVSLIILLALNLTTSHCNLIALSFANSIFYTPLKVNASNLIVVSTLRRLLPRSVLKYSFG